MGEKECCQKSAISFVYEQCKLSESSIPADLTLDNAATARKAFKMIKNIYGLQSTVNVATRRFFRKIVITLLIPN